MAHSEAWHNFAIALVGLTWLSSTHAQRFRSPWLHEVENLEAEPGYRSITLRWKYPHVPEPFAFRVQVCEVLPWQPRARCRVRSLEVPSRVGQRRFGDFSIDAKEPGHDTLRRGARKGWYQAQIQDLRMLSNYTVAVEPDFGSSRNSLLYASSAVDEDRLQLITSEFTTVTTKGFAARAERCLANSSEVVVRTGPYFAGKIAVEDAPEACSVVGNPASPLDAYTLLIDHKLCRSRIVNQSKIETNIIVHENRDIITHNTRRYLVVCSFVPDTYTITASVSLPTLNKKKTLVGKDLVPEVLDPNEVFTYKDSHVEDSRIAAEQHSLIRDSPRLESGSSSHAVLMVVLVAMGLVGCGVAVWYAMRSPNSPSLPSSKQPLCSQRDLSLSTEEKEHDCTVVSFVTIAGQPVAVLPDTSVSEA
ncbi:uncharacterized protein LOC135387627 isoform X2 [Ornithodoros turicata]